MARTREEQINGLGERINRGCRDLPMARILASNYILEAEQRGYERARAECADGADWFRELIEGMEVSIRSRPGYRRCNNRPADYSRCARWLNTSSHQIPVETVRRG